MTTITAHPTVRPHAAFTVPATAPAAPATAPAAHEHPLEGYLDPAMYADHLRARLAFATTVADEFDALLALLPPRNRQIVAAAWGAERCPAPSYTEVAAPLGISRERVRQIVARYTQRFTALFATEAVTLPLTARLIAALDANRGALSTAALLQIATADGVSLGSRRTLQLLPVVAALLGRPDVRYDARLHLWRSRRDQDWTHQGRSLEAHAAWMRRGVLLWLYRVGGCSEARIARATPLGTAWVAALALGEDAHEIAPDGQVTPVAYRLQRGWLLRRTQRDSMLTALVDRMLVVTPTLTIQELRRGLRPVRRKADWTRLSARRLAAVLSAHPAYALVADPGTSDVNAIRVSRLRPLAIEAALGTVEHAVFEAIMRHGGAMTATELRDAVWPEAPLSNVGAFRAATPILVRLTRGVYGLCGVSASADALRRIDRRRADQRLAVGSTNRGKAGRPRRQPGPDGTITVRRLLGATVPTVHLPAVMGDAVWSPARGVAAGMLVVRVDGESHVATGVDKRVSLPVRMQRALGWTRGSPCAIDVTFDVRTHTMTVRRAPAP